MGSDDFFVIVLSMSEMDWRNDVWFFGEVMCGVLWVVVI